MGVRKIVGVVGDVTAGLLLAAPGITFRGIVRSKSVGELTCYPYLATLLNCICWVLYGISTKNLAVAIINGLGIVAEGVYCVLYIAYSGGTRRVVVSVFLVSEFIFGAILATILFTILHHEDMAHAREVTFGVLGSVTGVIMYASPIVDMVNVVRTKDKSNMSLPLAIFSLVNGVTWTVYALLKPHNWYILIPNAVGIVCAFTQLILYVLASLRVCCFKPAQ